MEKGNHRSSLCNASFIYLLTTLVVTSLATGLLATTMLTDFWEIIVYDNSKVQEIAASRNGSHRLTWLFSGKVARIVQYSSISHSPSYIFNPRTPETLHSPSLTVNMALDLDDSRSPDLAMVSGKRSRDYAIRKRRRQTKREISSRRLEWRKADNTVNGYQLTRNKRDAKIIFLVPLHGGIWHLCVDLNENEMRILREMGMTHKLCTEYLTNPSGHVSNETARHDHHIQSKMHNLSISCAMVCIILLGAAALLGLFGVLQPQISAVLITGVMYILAALFAVFSLTIMHFKRSSHRDCGIINDAITREYHGARVFATGWSMHLGWAGSCFMFFASLLWIFLAKVMRYNQLTFW